MCSQVFISPCFLSNMRSVLRCGHSLKSYEDCNMETQGPQPGYCFSQAFSSFPTSYLCLFPHFIFCLMKKEKKKENGQTSSLQMWCMHAWGALEQQECCLVLLEETSMCIVFRGLNLVRATVAWICNEKNARHIFQCLLLGSGPPDEAHLVLLLQVYLFLLLWKFNLCILLMNEQSFTVKEDVLLDLKCRMFSWARLFF